MDMQTREGTAAVAADDGIDVDRIERELAALWRPAQGAGGASAESGVTRVCVLNLIVYAAGREERGRIDELLDEVIERAPCRALVLLADRAAADARVEAYVSTRCQVSPRGAEQVCGEQVTIEANGEAVERAASAVEPLLVPDVPVFLWWRDIPHEGDTLFARLVGTADRVVIDSLAFARPYEDLPRLAEMMRAGSPAARFSDLNWGRLTSWRNLVASFWDVADYRDSLARIDRVTIEYDPPRAAPDCVAPHALLLLGWLASSLKWRLGDGAKPLDERTVWFRFNAGGREVLVELRPTQAEEGCDGLLASLTLEARGPGASFYVGVNREWTKLETSAKIDGAQRIGRVVAYEAKSEGERLSRELNLLARDAVYEAAVAAAAELIGSLKRGRRPRA